MGRKRERERGVVIPSYLRLKRSCVEFKVYGDFANRDDQVQFRPKRRRTFNYDGSDKTVIMME